MKYKGRKAVSGVTSLQHVCDSSPYPFPFLSPTSRFTYALDFDSCIFSSLPLSMYFLVGLGCFVSRVYAPGGGGGSSQCLYTCERHPSS